MRWTAWALALALVGCTQKARLAKVEGGIQPPVQVVDFGTVYRGYPKSMKVDLVNTAPTVRTAKLTLQGPFYIDTFREDVPGASEGAPTLTFEPDFVGPADGTLQVESEGHQWQVKLVGVAADPPTCDASTACVPVHFDPDTGQCVTETLPDGTPCADNCLDAPTCQGGQCVGAPKSCDDGSVCTADSCDPATGCVHDDLSASCPQPEDGCHAAMCDPLTGCGLVQLPDETLCGPSDCVTKHACQAGVCTEEPTEDGFVCAPGSPCQAAGHCRQHVCVQLPVEPLQPSWVVPLDIRAPPQISGLVEDGSGLNYLSWSAGQTGGLAQVDPGGTVDLHVSYGPNAPMLLASTPGGLWASQSGKLVALSAESGSQRLQTPVADPVQLAEQSGLLVTSRRSAQGDVPAIDDGDGSVAWTLGAVNATQQHVSRAIGDGEGRFFVHSVSNGSAGWLRAVDEHGQELWSVSSSGAPLLVASGALLASDGVVRATDDGRVLFDTGAPVTALAGDPVSDGRWLWIPRARGGAPSGVEVWDITSGQRVGGVDDPSSFSGLRQLTATARQSVIAEDGNSLVELDATGQVVWSCPVVGEPAWGVSDASGRGPLPLLQGGSYLRVAHYPQGSPSPALPGEPLSQRYMLQGFQLGIDPADQGWITAGGNFARTFRPR